MAIIGTSIPDAVRYLNEGKLVAIPTETVYGLAGNALDPGAVAEIFRVKNRPSFDPVIVHVSGVRQAAQCALVDEPALQLMKKFWPGPLTLLLPKKESIPDLVTSGLPRVGIRCPDHPITLDLLRQLQFPLAAPSANPFGYISPTTAQHVQDQLGDQISYILDGGPCRVGLESTIVGWEKGSTVVYRQGGLSLETIIEVTGPLEEVREGSSRPQAPGQLQSHYAPNRKFLLGNLEALISQNKGKRIGVLSFREHPAAAGVVMKILSPEGKLSEAAQNLFRMMRELDREDIDVVIAEPVPDEGLGRAINDRLRRAAAER